MTRIKRISICQELENHLWFRVNGSTLTITITITLMMVDG